MEDMGQPHSHTGEPGGALPPGQRTQRGWPVTHYGPVPRFRPERWEFRVFGATADGGVRSWTHDEFGALPYETVVADLHCVTKFSMPGSEWGGVRAATLLALVPPAPGVTHVMAWAEYGYSANLRLADFQDPSAVLATHRDGELLTAEHGFPLRLVVPGLYAWKGPKWLRGVEYMTADRRGFWEERGYHNIGDPWREQRYSYQEEPGEGPEL
ncbi:sulfite oxidase-like oxidoreductase [Streptomyces sp. RFCAC02]|uniref:sulfite oxidase-like oxidoreductase n=1 Tax=Streptomyces sp. RFCAC02 TaxID=2499143 RepID=UPI00143DF7FF|nr:sulfite oxidase-like oxidoreductase [Streptomyces sp. RFCAC02]